MYRLLILTSFVLQTLPTLSFAAPQAVVQPSSVQAWVTQFEDITPTARPSSVEEASSILSSIHAVPTAKSQNDMVRIATAMMKNGIVAGDIKQMKKEYHKMMGNLSIPMKHPEPHIRVYPRIAHTDPHYDVPEASLRHAIIIPPTFTYGKKPPVILFPGTGSIGSTAFLGNYIKLLTNVDYADPVWIDVPGFLFGDAQTNAEYAAYAINYISTLTKQNVSVIAWSQGNLDNQWALKYWPSTRSKVSDLISISPDFHGTVEVYLLCPPSPLDIACTPGVIQQEYKSHFVEKLRSSGGDSAYVPTTSIYTKTDEIVEPQFGLLASAHIKDARGVGVSNTLVQKACFGMPAGGIVTHEGLLANPLAFALAVDALKHPGPGSLARINHHAACSSILAPGLDLEDFLLTETNILIALIVGLEYFPKVLIEPPIKPYALLY